MRHQHKYLATPLPPHRRFYFHTSGEPAAVATVAEFTRHIRHCDPAVLSYHLTRGDFSRWITGTLTDYRLGRHLAAIERDLTNRHAADLERARQQIINTIGNRYPRPTSHSSPTSHDRGYLLPSSEKAGAGPLGPWSLA